MIPQYTKNKNKGYILESGSNNNGSYIKYSDGTIIQTGIITKNINISSKSSYSDVYYDDGYFIDFPIPFLNTNYYTDIKAESKDAVSLNVYSISDQTNEMCKFNLCSISTLNLSNFKFRWLAVGKWK